MLSVEEFQEYEDQFNNAPDKSAFFDRYYDPNIVFIHPNKGCLLYTSDAADDLVSV